MSNPPITAEQVVQSVYELPPDKLTLVYEFVQALATTSAANADEDAEVSLPLNISRALAHLNGFTEHDSRTRRHAPSAMGKYAHVPGSVEEFMQRKQPEIFHEDRQRS